MKNLINLFAALFTMLQIGSAQMPSNVMTQLMEAEQTLLTEMIPTSGHEALVGIPVRVINNAHSDRLFIQPQVVLSEATLNIIDVDGNALLAYHFNHLSEIDLSIKRLPVGGDYTLNLKSKEGVASYKVVR